METKKISTPVQNRSKESKERIIQAALELFGTKGIKDVTTKMIAEKAGVATGSLYVYFRDKKDITKAVLERNCELFLHIDDTEIIRSEGNVIRAIERILNELRESMGRWNVPFVEMQLLENGDPEIKALIDAFNAQILQLAKEMISSTPLTLRPANADIAAAYVFLVIDSYLFRLPYYSDLIDMSAITHEVALAIGMYLFGDQALRTAEGN